MMKTTTYEMQVWQEAQRLKAHASRLWRNPSDREDGISETILRAISKRHLFDGTNLAAWMTTMMTRISRDQALKGYKRGTKVGGPRTIYVGDYEYASHVPTLDSPEAILIAVEDYSPRKMQGRRAPWDDDSVRTMLALRSHGCSHEEIASHIGRTTRAVRAKIESLGGRSALETRVAS